MGPQLVKVVHTTMVSATAVVNRIDLFDPLVYEMIVLAILKRPETSSIFSTLRELLFR